MTQFDEEYLMLSAQGALLQAVTPELRAVTVRFYKEENRLWMAFFYDGEISDKHSHIATSAMMEASCKFPADYMIDEGVIRLDYPAPIPNEGRFVYHRYEPKEEIDEVYVRLLAQQALLDKVTPELRSLIFRLQAEEKSLQVTFFYDGQISDRNKDLAERFLAKVQADLPSDYRLSHELLRLDYPEKIPYKGKIRILYERYEPTVPQ